MGVDFEKLINVSLYQAESICRKHGMKMRVISRDGKQLMRTLDYEESRVNVDIKDNVVIKVEGVG